MKNSVAFLRRKNRRRYRLKKCNRNQNPRLSINRSLQHIYGQIIGTNGEIIISFSSNTKDFRESSQKSYNKEGAEFVGKILGEKAKEKGITQVIVDVGAYQYHGRVAALVESFYKNLKA